MDREGETAETDKDGKSETNKDDFQSNVLRISDTLIGYLPIFSRFFLKLPYACDITGILLKLTLDVLGTN